LLAQAIVETPLGRYSPVLFYGDMGMGKTHLLQAIARGLIERGNTVIYVTAEDFTNQLVASIRSRENPAFRDRYRTADAVIVDDAQFIEGKDSTENEIVAIWDALRNRQKAMIFAADRLPADMPRLSADVRSRLSAGPIAPLDAPGYDLRAAILQTYSQARAITLPPDLGDRLAALEPISVRELQGKIDQICTYTQLTGQSVRAAVENVLATSVPGAKGESCSLETVLLATADRFHLSVDDLTGRQRTKDIAHARQIAMYMARELTSASLPQIGAALGGRDHSTVLHGCAKIASQLSNDPALAQELQHIRDQLRPTPKMEFSYLNRIVR